MDILNQICFQHLAMPTIKYQLTPKQALPPHCLSPVNEPPVTQTQTTKLSSTSCLALSSPVHLIQTPRFVSHQWTLDLCHRGTVMPSALDHCGNFIWTIVHYCYNYSEFFYRACILQGPAQLVTPSRKLLSYRKAFLPPLNIRDSYLYHLLNTLYHLVLLSFLFRVWNPGGPGSSLRHFFLNVPQFYSA